MPKASENKVTRPLRAAISWTLDCFPINLHHAHSERSGFGIRVD